MTRDEVIGTALIGAREHATAATRRIVFLADEMRDALQDARRYHGLAASKAAALGVEMNDAVGGAELAALAAAETLLKTIDAHREHLVPPAGWREHDSDIHRALVALGL